MAPTTAQDTNAVNAATLSYGGRRKLRSEQLMEHAKQMEWIAQQTQTLELKRQLETGQGGGGGAVAAVAPGVPTEDPAAPLVATCLKAAESFSAMEMEKAAAMQQEMLARGESAIATAKQALQEAGAMVMHTVQKLVVPWKTAAAEVQRHAEPVKQQCFAMMSSGGWATLQQSTYQAACKACDVVMHVLPNLLHNLQSSAEGSRSGSGSGSGDLDMAERHARVLQSLIGVRDLVDNFVQTTAALRAGAPPGAPAGTPAALGSLAIALHTMNTLANRANEALTHYNGAKMALQEARQGMDAIRTHIKALHTTTVTKCRDYADRAHGEVQVILQQVDPASGVAATATGGRGATSALALVARANRQSLLARVAFEVDRLQNLCPPS
jgi:hypothetical protein